MPRTTPPSSSSTPVEQPPASDIRPLEAELRTADIAGDEALAGTPDPADPEGSRESRIRQAAYNAYQRRGGAPGHDEEDWLEAERVVDAEDRARNAEGKG